MPGSELGMEEAISSALQAVGRRLMELREEVGGRVHEIQGTQVKAEADLHAHALLKQKLTRIEDIPVLSEEDVQSHEFAAQERFWCMDPIDGTASFVGGFPGFVTQAALIANGTPVLAGVHAPALDKTYTARHGAGAHLNGASLPHLRNGPLRSLVDNYPEPRGIAKDLFEALGFNHYLESGSLGLKACLVAEGKADVFFKDVAVQTWDVAPAELILREVGGWLSDARGDAFGYRGHPRHHGVVAARSPETASQVLQWYRNQTNPA